jgi:hypothetical protein
MSGSYTHITYNGTNISNGTITLTEGDEATLDYDDYIAEPGASEPIDDWLTIPSNNSVASIDAYGNITAIGAGTITIELIESYSYPETNPIELRL